MSRASSFARRNLVATGIIALVALGTLGAGLKYLDEDAQRVMASRRSGKSDPSQNDTLLNRINPFLPTLPNPTPLPLSKEYIYAGSRLLAVEDANASAIIPSDLAVWRPTTGVWWVLGGPGSQQFSSGWGTNGDKPQPGDYDGDGRTDLAVFRPSSGQWWIMKSSDLTYYSLTFGLASDEPAPADYDGDGRTDVAVFRPSTGYWYMSLSSTNSVVQAPLGGTGDVPAPKDYDGDGKADIAVWRASNKSFYSVNSGNFATTIVTISTAGAGSEAVPADYDGDGKADQSVRSEADWIIRKSSNGATETVGWGAATGDTAVQNDYDGDGKVDIAVWRATNGTWYIRQSSNGSPRTQQWGMEGDIPVPALYRR